MSEFKDEMKIALVMDDYKLKNKEDWWAKALDSNPELRDNYIMVKEEILSGITSDTTTIIRHFKRKGLK